MECGHLTRAPATCSFGVQVWHKICHKLTFLTSMVPTETHHEHICQGIVVVSYSPRSVASASHCLPGMRDPDEGGRPTKPRSVKLCYQLFYSREIISSQFRRIGMRNPVSNEILPFRVFQPFRALPAYDTIFVCVCVIWEG